MFRNILLYLYQHSLLIITLITVLLISVSYYLIQTYSSQQKKYVSLINISGKQRMHSQKTALLVEQILKTNSTDTNQYLYHLNNAIVHMQRNHSHILEEINDPELLDLYYKKNGINDAMQDYINLLQNFLTKNHESMVSGIYLSSSKLIPLLDYAVKKIEEKSKQEIDLVSDSVLNIYLFLLTLIVLFVSLFYKKLHHQKQLSLQQNIVQKNYDDLKLLRNIFSNSLEAILITDKDLNILEVNKAFSEITYYHSSEVIGTKPSILSSGVHDSSFYNKFYQELNEKNRWSGEFVNVKKDGTTYHQRSHILQIKDELEEVTHYVNIFEEV